jgi:hypothetical protein
MELNDNLTTAERAVLDEIHQLLGDNLSDFLLSGLGETSITHRRAFSARSMLRYGDEITYQLKIINDSEQGLPIERDPLVLASLLNILWEHQPLDNTILFRQADILEKLGWDDDAESHSLIKRALERYAFTTFCLVDQTHTEEESLGYHYARVWRLLIGCEIATPLYPLKKRGQPKYATSEPLFGCANFLPSLIQDVISKRKSFLGIDFQMLKEIRLVSAE